MLDWGGTTRYGFTAVSRAFLQNYRALGLSMEEAMLVLHILDFQWGARLPFPKVETLVDMTGRSDQTIRKYLRKLRTLGLLRTVNRKGRSNQYDFSPLFVKLREIIEESRRAKKTEEAEEKPAEEPEFELLDGTEDDDEPEETTQNLHSRTPAKRRGTLGGEWRPKPKSTATQNSHSLPTQDLYTVITRTKNKKDYASPLEAVIASALAVARERARGRVAMPRKDPRGYMKRMAKFSDKPPESYNTSDLEIVFRTAWFGRGWRAPPAAFTMKDKGQLKRLVEEFGPRETAEVITAIVTQWDVYMERYRVNGRPSVAVIYGFRGSWFSEVLDGEETAKPSWGSHFTEGDADDDGGATSFFDD